MSSPRHWAVVPAAGSGSRMGATLPKQYLQIGERSILWYTLQRLLADQRIAGVVVVVDDNPHWTAIAESLDAANRIHTAPGGVERCHSVLHGIAALSSLAQQDDWVLVHDAARPCLSTEELDRLIIDLDGDAVGGLLALPVNDTVKRADADNRSTQTVDRAGLWRAQTPQMFRLGLLYAALTDAIDAGVAITDEAMAVERAGYKPKLVPGSVSNIKITQPQDLELATYYLRQQGVLCA